MEEKSGCYKEQYIKVIDNHFYLIKEASKVKKGIDIIGTTYMGVDSNLDELVNVIQVEKNEKVDQKKLGLERECLELLIKDSYNKHIINIKDCLESKRNRYFIVENCRGPSLRQYQEYYFQKYKKQLNEVFIQKIVRQLIVGLQYIHSLKIIHRTLNLDNILLHFDKYSNFLENGYLPAEINLDDINLNESFTVKISDFYNSKIIKENNNAMTVIFPNNNVPPDVLNKRYDTRFDLWLLGGIIYQLLTGVPAFIGETEEDIFDNIKSGKYFPPNQRVSVEILTFINGLLRYNPNDRMTWDEINKHPFIKKNPNNFIYFNFGGSDKEKELQLNTKSNTLGIFLKGNGLDINLDEITLKNISSNETLQKQLKQNFYKYQQNEEVNQEMKNTRNQRMKDLKYFENKKKNIEEKLRKEGHKDDSTKNNNNNKITEEELLQYRISEQFQKKDKNKKEYEMKKEDKIKQLIKEKENIEKIIKKLEEEKKLDEKNKKEAEKQKKIIIANIHSKEDIMLKIKKLEDNINKAKNEYKKLASENAEEMLEQMKNNDRDMQDKIISFYMKILEQKAKEYAVLENELQMYKDINTLINISEFEKIDFNENYNDDDDDEENIINIEA